MQEYVGTLRVTGLRELNRAFAQAGKDVRKDVRTSLARIADPVRADAESLALSEIRNVGPRWSQFRVGVTQKSVYVMPKQRGTRNSARKRPQFAPIVMERALIPAAKNNQQRINTQLTSELYRQLIRHGFQVKGTGL